MHGEYYGKNWKEIKQEMQVERNADIAARKESARQRALAARLRKEAIEDRQEEPTEAI